MLTNCLGSDIIKNVIYQVLEQHIGDGKDDYFDDNRFYYKCFIERQCSFGVLRYKPAFHTNVIVSGTCLGEFVL